MPRPGTRCILLRTGVAEYDIIRAIHEQPFRHSNYYYPAWWSTSSRVFRCLKKAKAKPKGRTQTTGTVGGLRFYTLRGFSQRRRKQR